MNVILIHKKSYIQMKKTVKSDNTYYEKRKKSGIVHNFFKLL